MCSCVANSMRRSCQQDSRDDIYIPLMLCTTRVGLVALGERKGNDAASVGEGGGRPHQTMLPHNVSLPSVSKLPLQDVALIFSPPTSYCRKHLPKTDVLSHLLLKRKKRMPKE